MITINIHKKDRGGECQVSWHVKMLEVGVRKGKTLVHDD